MHKNSLPAQCGRGGRHVAVQSANKGLNGEKRISNEGMTNDSIVSGATSDQQESYSSFFGGGSDSKVYGSDEEMLEKQDAAGKRERERVCGGEKQNQRSADDSRLDESADCTSLRSQSQSSAMASMLSMPSGPAPLHQAGPFSCL